MPAGNVDSQEGIRMGKLRIGVIGVCGRGGIANHWRDSGRAEIVGGAEALSHG